MHGIRNLFGCVSFLCVREATQTPVDNFFSFHLLDAFNVIHTRVNESNRIATTISTTPANEQAYKQTSTEKNA